MQFAIDHGLGKTRATVADNDFALFEKVDLLKKQYALWKSNTRVLVQIRCADTSPCSHGMRQILAGDPRKEFTG